MSGVINRAGAKARATKGRLLGSKTKSMAQIEKTLDDHTTKIDEALFFIHRLKNGVTVRTGEFEALTTLFTGQKIYVDTRDISVAPHLMLDGHWEPEITEVFRRYVQSGDVVVDAGANFGYFGVVAGTSIGRDGRVFFIEANPDLIPYIEKTIAVNGLNGRAIVSNVGLAAKEGTLELKILGDYWGSSTFADSDDSSYLAPVKETKKIRSTSLDKYCKENNIKQIDVLKMDIEGYEDIAYQGMGDIVKNSPNLKLFLEFTPHVYRNPKKFYEKIAKDFKYIYHIDQSHPESLKRIDSYSQLSKATESDWAMIMALKKEDI